MSQPPRRPMPPPLTPPPPARWADTPPAVFPPLLGLMGLGLGWRVAAEQLGAPEGIGELILGAGAALLGFCAVAWLSKPLRRPAVVIDEMRALPGRTGLAAMTGAVMLLAAALAPLAPSLAAGVLGLGLAAHLLVIVLVAVVLLGGPAEGRVVTPAFHLIFAGPILATIAAVPLGYEAPALAVFWLTVAVATAIWATSAVQLVRRIPPAPLRPLLAIHLAPASVFAITATQLGLHGVATGFAVLALGLLLALLASARWITQAGFSALWGAFTFPISAAATAFLGLGGVPGAAWLGGALLVAGTLAVPAIAFKVLQAWAKGTLAAKTNAARV